MIRIAIVGCGKIADQHIQSIPRVPDCKVVSLCDRELLMAQQLGTRIGVDQCFSDVGEMLKQTQPDVVHITTPPQSHFELAKQCLEAGSHVYLEKPFTITAEETEALIRFADERSRKITVGHNGQFTSEMLEMRRLVANGFLGGKPVHVESYSPYSLDDASYVGPIFTNREHWVRKLPGQILHNVISHGIAKLVEFLDDDLVEIVASAHQSEQLRQLGGAEMVDELRVMMRDKSGTTAYFCFSTQIKPGVSQLRLYGPKGSLVVDNANGSVIRNPARSYKSYLTYVVPPLNIAREYFRNGWRNFFAVAGQRLYLDYGMKTFFERFYESAKTGGPPPLPYREIILTSRILDEIFRQIRR